MGTIISESELFDAVNKFSSRQRTIYEVGLAISLGATVVLSSGIIAGLSALLANTVIDAHLAGDALMGIVILPGIMSFVFVAAGVHPARDAHLQKTEATLQAGRRGLRIGYLIGFVVIIIVHFLSQLLISRAVYGPFRPYDNPLMYCGLMPLLYGFIFAIPVALGSGVYSAYQAISTQVIYELAATYGKK